jgi:hypothetical protein
VTRVAADEEKKGKVGFWMKPTDAARARAAFLHTMGDERHGSFSDFIAAAVLKETRRLEKRYHDGDPWPGAEAGRAPAGRPVRRA